MITKPLYTHEYIAFSPFDRHALRTLVRRLDNPFKRLAEIGSWMGNGSTRVIVQELLDRDGVLYCIDHWQGNSNVQRHQELVAQYDIFNTFRFNVESYGGAELVKPLVMSSSDAAAIFQDRSLDLVFIDGDHSYEQTRSDIERWLPKVAKGGVLCGHDCEARVRNCDEGFLRQNRNRDTIQIGGNIPVIHPGTVLAVGEAFGDAAHCWCEEIITLEDGTPGRSSIWDLVVDAL
jgi:predicted O-methyltransferase YrrM